MHSWECIVGIFCINVKYDFKQMSMVSHMKDGSDQVWELIWKQI